MRAGDAARPHITLETQARPVPGFSLSARGMLQDQRMGKHAAEAPHCCPTAWEGRLTCPHPSPPSAHTGDSCGQATAPKFDVTTLPMPTRQQRLCTHRGGTAHTHCCLPALHPGPFTLAPALRQRVQSQRHLPRPFTQQAPAAIPAAKFAFLDAQFTFSVPPRIPPLLLTPHSKKALSNRLKL